jgi:leucyl aminopeptidase
MQLKTKASFEELLGAIDLLCIPTSRDRMDHLHHEVLSMLVPAETLPPPAQLIQPKSSSTLFFGQWKGHRIKILVSGENDPLTEASVYAATKKLSIKAKSEQSEKIGLMVHHLVSSELVQSAMAGWTAGQYDLGIYKKAEETALKSQPELYTFLPSGVDVVVAEDGITVGMVQQEVMNLVNTPSNHQTPALLGEWAIKNAARYGFTAKILDKKQLYDLGMHAILAVNRGSEEPALMIVTHYKHPDAKKKVALVGKGVIFDTGGVSIKDSKNMHYMKSDMAGAAAALGTVEACARLKLKVDVMAITPVTDNSIGSAALKPGDVISSYAGKSIEVIDTDAEGRLILADALAYAVKEYQPDIMIDMATLTGSIIAAIGPHAAGLFTKNDQLADSLRLAGEATGERLWRMPMFDEYHEDMQSDIADIKNLSEKPYAGSITAAKFLEYFTSEHPAWAHLDIAGMGFQPNGFGKGNCATAYGVRLLLKWLAKA